jgi:phospholipase C
MTNSLSKVDTFVVLMLENRSFDHMLGFLRNSSYPIEGLDGGESNPVHPNDPSSQHIQATRDAAYVGDLNNDPGHRLDPNVITQLYGLSRAAIKQLPTYPARRTTKNNGFV